MLLKSDMIETLISSKTRVKLLLKFFLNSSNKSYLRNLESEFGESSNAIRLELNKLEQAGMLVSENEKNKKWFKANLKHPLFPDIQNIIKKYTGIDWIVDYILKKLGNVEKIFLVGKFAQGLNDETIEIVIIGKTIEEDFLKEIISKTEKQIEKKVKYEIFNSGLEFISLFKKENKPYLLLYEK